MLSRVFEFFIIGPIHSCHPLTEPSMKFAIALYSPAHAASSRRALLFAQAVLCGGHHIVRLFFYQDGVNTTSAHVVTPPDNLHVPPLHPDACP